MGAMHAIKEFFGFVEDEDIEDFPLAKSEPEKPALRAVKPMPNNKHYIVSEIMVEEPRIYEDSLNIATHLRENKPTVVNLKHLDSDAGKRLIDFVCGTAYAINGHMMKIADNIFLFTPAKVHISDASENNAIEVQEEKTNPTYLYTEENEL